MTICTDQRYREVEMATVAKAEARLTARYIEVYGEVEGPRRLHAFFKEMAANILSDSRPVCQNDLVT